jgi:ATP-dependent RNA helicase SUPV3L1/SUV3
MKPLRRSACKHFVLLTGPTNSGKTWRALEQLKAAPSGVYAAPLRLLAYEGFRKLNESGVPTSLVTGQQRIVVPNAKHVACTVEMIPTAQKVDVCVLDEMQLIGDPSRGFAWTRAILQNQATHMYLCGQANAVPLVKRLVSQERGAVVEVQQFERFNQLQVQDRAMGKVSNGDCIVCFSRKELYRIKRALEETGKTVNIVYGALPPEARVVQAEQFNKGDSVLVATDAVGLGLNLQIKRVVFSTVWKFDGTERRRLTPCEVKQIGGRSGRGVKDEFGYVTALEEEDRAYLADCFATEAPEVMKAGFLPGLEDLLLLAGGDVEDNAPLSGLYRDYLEQHHSLPELEDYFLCELDDIVDAADVCDAEAPSLDMRCDIMRNFFFSFFSSARDTRIQSHRWIWTTSCARATMHFFCGSTRRRAW